MNLAQLKILAGLDEEARQLALSLDKDYVHLRTNIIKKAFADFENFFEAQGFKLVQNNGSTRIVKFFALEISLQLILEDVLNAAALFVLSLSQPEKCYEILLVNKGPALADTSPAAPTLAEQIAKSKETITFLQKRRENIGQEEWAFYLAQDEDTKIEYTSLKNLLSQLFEVA